MTTGPHAGKVVDTVDEAAMETAGYVTKKGEVPAEYAQGDLVKKTLMFQTFYRHLMKIRAGQEGDLDISRIFVLLDDGTQKALLTQPA